MADRQILMSAPMVRALRAGTKTQTRRIVKPQPAHSCHYEMNGAGNAALHLADAGGPNQYVPPTPRSKDHRLPCPYGAPGDRLWVRENGWQRPERSERDMRDGADTWPAYEYDADGIDHAHVELLKEWGWKRRPSIHMPRWASRITLELTEVRVQRVQDISAEDVLAEGIVDRWSRGNETWPAAQCDEARDEYRMLWESINGLGSWAANLWVWALTFRVLP